MFFVKTAFFYLHNSQKISIYCSSDQPKQGNTMNKQELVDAILKDKHNDIETKAAAERSIKTVLDNITTGIKKDGTVQLIGFGTFQIKKRSARKGRNPATGEEIKIKASKSVGFKPSSALKEVATKSKAKI